VLQWRTQEFCSGGGGSPNSVEDRGHREQGCGGGSRLVTRSAQFVNELLGFYGCIFHGNGNSAQLCQNFGISGEGGF
jgi:hypothetical protein